MELDTGYMGFPMPTMRGFNSKAEALEFAKKYIEELAKNKDVEL